jgi:hypothetical protein
MAAIDTGGQHGRCDRTITYATNDPALPRFEVTVSANISKPVLE